MNSEPLVEAQKAMQTAGPSIANVLIWMAILVVVINLLMMMWTRLAYGTWAGRRGALFAGALFGAIFVVLLRSDFFVEFGLAPGSYHGASSFILVSSIAMAVPLALGALVDWAERYNGTRRRYGTSRIRDAAVAHFDKPDTWIPLAYYRVFSLEVLWTVMKWITRIMALFVLLLVILAGFAAIKHLDQPTPWSEICGMFILYMLFASVTGGLRCAIRIRHDLIMQTVQAWKAALAVGDLDATAVVGLRLYRIMQGSDRVELPVYGLELPESLRILTGTETAPERTANPHTGASDPDAVIDWLIWDAIWLHRSASEKAAADAKVPGSGPDVVAPSPT